MHTSCTPQTGTGIETWRLAGQLQVRENGDKGTLGRFKTLKPSLRLLDSRSEIDFLQAVANQRRGTRTLVITAADGKTIVVGLAADSGTLPVSICSYSIDTGCFETNKLRE